MCVCACVLLRDIWSPGLPHATPLAGGLSALRGREHLIFHRSRVHPWTPSLSPHVLQKESWSVNTEICGLPAPSPPCCSLTCWASQLKASHSYRCWQLSLTLDVPLCYYNLLFYPVWNVDKGQVTYQNVCWFTEKEKQKPRREREKRKQQEFPKAFHFERFQTECASMQAKPSAPTVLVPPPTSIHHINRKPKPKVFITTLQNPVLGISSSGQNFFHHLSHSSEAKPCSVFAVMYAVELDFGQREQKELHRHHYSARSNPI